MLKADSTSTLVFIHSRNGKRRQFTVREVIRTWEARLHPQGETLFLIRGRWGRTAAGDSDELLWVMKKGHGRNLPTSGLREMAAHKTADWLRRHHFERPPELKIPCCISILDDAPNEMGLIDVIEFIDMAVHADCLCSEVNQEAVGLVSEYEAKFDPDHPRFFLWRLFRLRDGRLVLCDWRGREPGSGYCGRFISNDEARQFLLDRGMNAPAALVPAKETERSLPGEISKSHPTTLDFAKANHDLMRLAGIERTYIELAAARIGGNDISGAVEACILGIELLPDNKKRAVLGNTYSLRRLAEEIGCSPPYVHGLPIFKARMTLKRRQGRPKKEISLSHKMHQVVGEEDPTLNRLIEDFEDGQTERPKQVRVSPSRVVRKRIEGDDDREPS